MRQLVLNIVFLSLLSLTAVAADLDSLMQDDKLRYQGSADSMAAAEPTERAGGFQAQPGWSVMKPEPNVKKMSPGRPADGEVVRHLFYAIPDTCNCVQVQF